MSPDELALALDQAAKEREALYARMEALEKRLNAITRITKPNEPDDNPAEGGVQ